MKEVKDSQARDYQLTINNPEEKNMGHEEIKKILYSFPTIMYWCLCDEIGEQKTPHTHVYLKVRNPIKFSTMKNKFPTAHIEKSLGSAEDNRNYIRKEGKWTDTEKKETNLPETFEEWGELPKSNHNKRSDMDILLKLIKEGLSDAEILNSNPNYIRYLTHIEKVRQSLREDYFKTSWRDIECIYVFGETNTNKTRTYMEKYGYTNVYRVTNYHGNAVWDGYRGQDAVIFEEYRSQIMVSEMLTWTEGYPNCCLRARYTNRVACFTKVIFISNIPLEEQYPNIQHESPETWRAFLRRIEKVIHHKSREEIITYNSVDEYMRRNEKFHPLPPGEKTPFDDKEKEAKYEQEEMPFD